ncbi:hypothetical protein BDP27DRAFT_1565 [Rhodocollybia butyracea]|uniref:Histone-lysine N-methyltransferase, H3 lysine-36 specific n=1 Tax=Rhodocollybia butyracea TaxID=206335 RepID=A0A9P5QCL7_9AGAR|nr:hypothetical protein BDP27DRAFT_1565 [Rhodocollybia butyracea]
MDYLPKSEPGSPATQSMTFPSPSTADRKLASGSSSPVPTPSPEPTPNSSKKTAATQFIGHLPVAREEALKTFIEIPDNWYQYKTLGRVKELEESMICDCTFDLEYDEPEAACGHNSDCINRLTQFECVAGQCRCKEYCQNQRFQKKEYAPIEIVQTDLKGYGLRAEVDISKDSFIYEYVGDVVSNSSFKKRMRDYVGEGIQHFYFMMLQKDEFIDATKNGGIGRFANHSCSPNCYVAKWTIDQHVRMGIFAKRNIKKDEELTFNYNVDRYGHQAQTCYCGEPNCVGFIGGKTQTETDFSTIDELYLDALGITDDAELQELKGTKKKKGKKIDDPDFMPQMRPVTEKEVPTVVQAIRQTQSKKMLFKLLTRLKITEEPGALRQVMRLRGYSLMKNILEDYMKDVEILTLCMWTWPLIVRNKVEDSQVSVPVKLCMESDNEDVKSWSIKLHSHWESLELNYRIPKKPRKELPDVQEESKPPSPPPVVPPKDPPKRPRNHHPNYRRHNEDDDPNARSYKRARYLGLIPTSVTKVEELLPPPPPRQVRPYDDEVQAIIEAAKAEKAEAEAKAMEQAETNLKVEEEKKLKKERVRTEESGSKSNGKKRHRDRGIERRKEKPVGEKDSEKEALKEKRLLKLISPVVVKSMSKHAPTIGHDRFKKHAKELTEKIANREKNSSAYQENRLDALPEEKIIKIKKYAKDYIDKLLRRMDSKHSHRKPSSTSASISASVESSATPSGSGFVGSPSPAIGTPTSAALQANMAAVDLDDGEAMDLDSDSESSDDEDVSGEKEKYMSEDRPTEHGKIVGDKERADGIVEMGDVHPLETKLEDGAMMEDVQALEIKLGDSIVKMEHVPWEVDLKGKTVKPED